MRVNYHPETDSLYIDLSEQRALRRDIRRRCPRLRRIRRLSVDIDNASRKVEPEVCREPILRPSKRLANDLWSFIVRFTALAR
jgi:hypothetical protein